MTKTDAFDVLRRFNSAQLDAAEMVLGLDSSVLPGRAEPTATRASEIVNYLTGPTGQGLGTLETYLKTVLPVGPSKTVWSRAFEKTAVRAVAVGQRRPSPPALDICPDIVLLTAADVEYETCIDLAGIRSELTHRRRILGGRTFIDLGLGSCSVWLFQCKKGSQSPGAAMAVVRDALASLEPRPFAVINTGIAFGLRPAKQDVGDVLVSEQIRLYELERRGPVRIARGDRPSSSDILLGWCRDFKVDWASSTADELRPRVHFGLLMSGEKLSDNSDFVAELLSAEPEAIGGEMEAAGVYAAAQGHPIYRIHWIIVKAICDWGMGKGDTHQEVAARNAIDFVFHVVGQPVVSAAVREFKGRRALG